MLKIALPTGSLEANTIKYFTDAGIKVRRDSRCYRASMRDGRVSSARFMRPQMIPLMVEEKFYDLGVTGSDLVAESRCKVTPLGTLNYTKMGQGNVNIVLFGAKDDHAHDLQSIPDGAYVVTEYPNLATAAFQEIGKSVKVVSSHGATESLVPYPFHYGISATVTGNTIQVNGLRIIHVISSETVWIIGNNGRFESKEKEMAVMSLLHDLHCGRAPAEV